MSNFIKIDPNDWTPDAFKTVPINELDGFNTMQVISIEMGPDGPIDKKIRAELKKILKMQQLGIIGNGITIGTHYLLDTRNGGRFIQVCLPNGGCQYIKMRGIDEIKIQPERLRIISGPCLFNISTASAIHEDGVTPLTTPDISIDKEVTDIQINSKISLYEAEALTRLTQFINTIASTTELSISIAINIPKVEYYLYILDAFTQGYIDTDKVLRWFDEVDCRSNRIKRLFESRINRLKRNDIVIENLNVLDQLADFIRGEVSQGLTPNLEDLKRIVSESDTLTRIIMSMESPTSFHELNYLSYKIAELKAGADPHTLAIAVENPIEEKIFIGASKLASELAKQEIPINLIGIYPHEKVVPDGLKSLYYYGGIPNMSIFKDVISQYIQ